MAVRTEAHGNPGGVKTGQEIMMFLDGLFTSSDSDSAIYGVNPSNGRAFLSLPKGSTVDVDRAVASARDAFQDGRWSEEPLSVRKRVLHRLADLISSDAVELDALDASEMGKPVAEALFNAAAAADLVRYYAEAVDKVMGDVLESDKRTFVAQRLVPRGVIAAVTPWNFPTFNAALKIAPALAAGNSVVLKPSEMSSLSAMRLADAAVRAGVPPGVLNVVPGTGEVVGRALGLHQDVDMIAFTGSTYVGKLMLQYAGQSNMKVVVAECGGKSPQIVFDDGVDLDAAAESIAGFLLTNQGQICSVGSRLLVQRSIEEAMVERIVSRMKSIVMGDALTRETTFGPLASATQCARVMEFIDSANAEGARLVTGGRRALRETGGYFVEPTLFRNVSSNSRIAQQEIFGPVLSVIPFDDEAEVVKTANGTMYGLMAYIWTANLSRGMRMAKAIRSSVLVNAAAPHGEGAGHAASIEPAGQSGVGCEGGLDGLKSYLRRQLVWINYE